MNPSISFCGLNCYGCTVYLITREPNLSKKNEMISEIIREIKKHYNVKYKFEDINGCDGCKTANGILFSGCSNCKIRNCAIEKGIDCCAYCADYPCENLGEMFKLDPSAKERLERIRSDFEKIKEKE